MNNNFNYFLKKFVYPHLFSLLFLLFLSFSSLLFSFISPLLTAILIDDVFIGKNLNLLLYIIIAYIGLYLFSTISSYFYNFLTGKLGVVLLKDVSESALMHVQGASIKNSQNFKVGDLITRIMGNVQIVTNIPVHIVPQIIVGIISIFVPFIIMIYLNLQLAVIAISPILFFCLLSFIFGKKMEKTQKIFLVENANVYSFLKEKLSILPLIKVFGLEKWSQDKFKGKMD